MNNFLRNLTATQQVGALFLVMFGILSVVTIWAFVRNLREHASDDPESEARILEAKRFWGLLKTSWMMASVFWIGWVLGDTVATVLFAIVGFFALREFISLAYTRRGDLVIGGDGTLRIGSGEQLSSDAGGPITVPALTEVKIGPDGTVFGKQVGGEAVVFQPLARIKVVDADPTKVVIRTDGLFESVDRTPFDAAATPAVQSGALEGSNVSLFSAMVDMIGMSRRYEMQVKVMKQASDLAADNAAAEHANTYWFICSSHKGDSFTSWLHRERVNQPRSRGARLPVPFHQSQQQRADEAHGCNCSPWSAHTHQLPVWR